MIKEKKEREKKKMKNEIDELMKVYYRIYI